MEVLTARIEWFGAMAAIAAEGGSPDANAGHLAFVAAHGRLLAATVDGTVVGFGGLVPAHGSHMVTDLFVSEAHRGCGVGGRLLAALLDGIPSAFTFSSTHPAALAAYRRAGLEPGWPLLTMRGPVHGVGAPLGGREWPHDRPELARHIVGQGGECTGDALLWQSGDSVTVLRLAAPADLAGLAEPADVMEGLMAHASASLGEGADMVLSVPPHSPVLEWVVLHGFRIDDVDIFCGAAGVVVPEHLWVVHRGLC